jgi:hypothetical protein
LRTPTEFSLIPFYDNARVTTFIPAEQTFSQLSFLPEFPGMKLGASTFVFLDMQGCKEVTDTPETVIVPYDAKTARRQWFTDFRSALCDHRRYGLTVREGSKLCSK